MITNTLVGLTMESVMLWTLVLSLGVQVWFYLVYFGKLTLHKSIKAKSAALLPVSIIICARNEKENLLSNLPLVLQQTYKEYEVIVVNDCSTDESDEVLESICSKFSHLRVVTVEASSAHEHGKKHALTVGVNAANHEQLLFTDADCKPNSNDWLRNMTQHFNDKTEIVLGYGAYEKQKGLLNKIIRFDTFLIALQYLSFSLSGKTYMGVGRNLAYKKSLFLKNKGFASHEHLASGDDDLFIGEAATKHNCSIETNSDSFTISKVKTTLTDWLMQKKRHVSTFSSYSLPIKMRLGLISLSHVLFFVSLMVLLVMQVKIELLLLLVAGRVLMQFIVFVKPMTYLKENDLILLFPFIEIALLLIYPFIIASQLADKKVSWK